MKPAAPEAPWPQTATMDNPMDSPKNTGRIAYVLEDFLTHTTTFITQEVQYLYNRDARLQVYVAGRCVAGDVDPTVRELSAIAQYSRPIHIRHMLYRHLKTMARFPLRYLESLWAILQATWKVPSYGLRTLCHFLEAIDLGQHMVNQHIAWTHTHFAGRAATVAWIIWRVYRIPYSVTTHAYDLYADFNNPTREPEAAGPPHPPARSLLNMKLEDAQLIVTISNFNVRFLTEKLGIEQAKIQVVRCGIDASRFYRSALPSNSVPVILSVGQLVEKKGHHLLLQACAYLQEWGVSFRCKIIGEGPMREELAALRASLGLDDCVQLCGRIHHSEIINYHRETDVFVLACIKGKDGNMDGIPVALMEAMAMGIPVVTTNISGIPELVDAGHTGFLVESGDPMALAETIGNLLRDEPLRQNIGRHGREKVLRDYDQSNNLPLIADLLDRGIERGAVRSRHSATKAVRAVSSS